jgi:hypothetical protein
VKGGKISRCSLLRGEAKDAGLHRGDVGGLVN